MTTTIQKTSKKLKGLLLLSGLLMVLGVVLAIVLADVRLLLTVGIGLLLRGATKILIWWEHA